jgi:hypothetical protein
MPTLINGDEPDPVNYSSSFIKGCICCGQPTESPDNRAILKCNKCALETWTPFPNVRRIKKAVKEVKA